MFKALTNLTSLRKAIMLPYLPTYSWYYHQKTCCFGLPWVSYERPDRTLDTPMKQRAWHARHHAGRGNSSFSHSSASTHQVLDSNFCFLGNFSWRQSLCQYFNIFCLWYMLHCPQGVADTQKPHLNSNNNS
jgi:hypothetical protein